MSASTAPAPSDTASAAETPTDAPPAYVLGGNEAGLAVVRSLGRAGIPVVSVLSSGNEHAGMSRYAGETVPAPDPVEELEAYVACLAELGDSRPGVIIPTTDESLEAVARHHATVAANHWVASPPFEIAERFLDKRRTAELAAEIDVPAPATRPIDTEADLDGCLDEVGLPCLLKPRESYRYNRAFGVKVARVHDEAGLHEAWRGADELDIGMLAQELVPGAETAGANYNVYMVDGEPVAELTAQKLRLSPPNFGFPSAVVGTPITEILEPGRRIVRAMGIEGFANVEFKRDDRDGRYKLMEVNGRPNMSGELAVRCGIDFPQITYEHLVHGILPDPSQTPGIDAGDGVYWIDEVSDLRSLLTRWRRGEVSLRAGLAPYASRHVFASLAATDPKPLVSRLATKLRGGATGRRDTTKG